MQSTKIVKVRTTVTRMQCITRLMIQNTFYFIKEGCTKFISVNEHYFDDEFIRHDQFLNRIRDKLFLCGNMIALVLHVVSDQFHVSRLDNPNSLQLIVDLL